MLALALASCGGSSSKPLTAAQLAARANAACARGNRALGNVTPPSGFSTTPAVAARFLASVRPAIHDEYRTLTSLTPPSSERAAYDAYKAAAAHELALFDTAASHARSGTTAYLSDLRTAALYGQSTLVPLAARLGFSACAR